MKERTVVLEVKRNDGEIFSINEDGTYSNITMKKDFPDHLHFSYTLKRLLSEHCFSVHKTETITIE
jgi:hypothetical protein